MGEQGKPKLSVEDVIAAVKRSTDELRRSADVLDMVVDYLERERQADEQR